PVARAGQSRHQTVRSQLAESRSVEDVVVIGRSEVPPDQEEGDRRARHPKHHRAQQAGKILARYEHLAAQWREVIVVERLLQNLPAEEVGKDSYASKEDAESQIVEVEQSREDKRVFSDAVASRVPRRLHQPMQSSQGHWSERQEVDPPSAP